MIKEGNLEYVMGIRYKVIKMGIIPTEESLIHNYDNETVVSEYQRKKLTILLCVLLIKLIS